ncbi:MAG: hypothetical protein MJA32_09785 [Proteobacteria bacterium]|nr:hypothetical protein [Pseudomonadota bacterium]
MSPGRFARAVFFPLTETGVLAALVAFWLLVWLAGAAGVMGLWLAVVVVPAVFRYLLLLLEARARGRGALPPGDGFFDRAHGVWTLFPAVVAVAAGWAAYAAYSSAGTVAMLAVLGVCGFIYPAVLAVLAITHSPLQSVNPIALYRFLHETGASYLIAPSYLLLIALLIAMTRDIAPPLRSLLEMFLLFSLHSVIGSMVESKGTVDDVYIADAVEPGAKGISSDIEKSRTAVLDHAYGFVSRDNRAGGFKHIIGEIDKDPDPAAAWVWYFDKMLGWEDRNHALFFARHYVRDVLRRGEHVAAVKRLCDVARSMSVSSRFPRTFPPQSRQRKRPATSSWRPC